MISFNCFLSINILSRCLEKIEIKFFFFDQQEKYSVLKSKGKLIKSENELEKQLSSPEKKNFFHVSKKKEHKIAYSKGVLIFTQLKDKLEHNELQNKELNSAKV